MTVTGNVTMSVPRTTVRACPTIPGCTWDSGRIGSAAAAVPAVASARRRGGGGRGRGEGGAPPHRDAVPAAFGRTLNHVSRSPSLPRIVQPLNVAVRPEAVVTRACTTRGEIPRRTT